MPGNQVEEAILEIRGRHPEAKHTVIFAPSLNWNGEMFQRPQQLARALAKCGALVFYLQPERVWPPVFTEIEERLILCRASADAFHVLPDAFVYVLTWNIPLLAYFSSPRVIYDYLDDLATFAGDPQRLRRDHGDYIIKADIVMTTAMRLYREASTLRSDSMLIPNGVDYAHFSQQPRGAPPTDLEPILKEGRPIIGYHGALAHWFDYELVKSIAQQRRDLSFVLIGVDHDQTLVSSGLLDEPNIHWLGAKPYKELPAYISRFDLGFIPFVVNEITHATSPIKLFEYFAAGKPVIVSPMQESVRYPQALAATKEAEWLQQIDHALQLTRDDQERQKLQQAGLQNTWENRAQDILKRMDEVSSQPRRLPWYMRFEPRNPRLRNLVRLVGRGIKVLRMSGWRGFSKGVYYKFYDRFARLRRSPLLRVPRSLDDTYVPEDNCQVILFTDQDAFCPDYQPRRPLRVEKSERPAVAVISTCRNEGDNAAGWATQLAKQTLLPDEIIVVDAGSTDSSVEILEATAQEHRLPLKVIKEPGANIAVARNIAVEAAEASVIASLDFGCTPHADWLENLTRPFSIEPTLEVSAGWYRAVDARGNESRFRGWPTLETVSPQDFIPSSRSLAFTKAAWERARGYPEWLTLTGEDTYFALELKRFCTHWAFVPEAVVDWRAPNSWMQFWKKAFTWSTGNGETGYNAWLYRTLLRKTTLGLTAAMMAVAFLGFLLWLGWGGIQASLWAFVGLVAISVAVTALLSLKMGRDPFFIPGMAGLRIAQAWGFLAGARQKAEVTLRKLKQARGIFFILAGVPIDDTGGGARCTQIALELLRQDYWVVYINRYPKWETQSTQIKIGHPNLFLYELSHFYWDDFAKQFEPLLVSLPKYALVELPSADFLPLIAKINQNGGRIIYEMIDDWNTALGGDWYSQEVEKQIIDVSHTLIGTAPVLQNKLAELSHRQVALLPNAVNSRLFNPERFYKRPEDLPQAEWTAAYIGALWGSWFDWDLFIALAHRYPQSLVVAIGDYRGQCPDPPANLRFLGLKPQTALPAYLAHIDVAIIPWKVNEITQATSPLKLYEYLAMRRPVIVPDLNPLRGIPGVFRARNTEEFIRLVNEVREEKHISVEAMDAFVGENNWGARVRQLLAALEKKH